MTTSSTVQNDHDWSLATPAQHCLHVARRHAPPRIAPRLDGPVQEAGARIHVELSGDKCVQRRHGQVSDMTVWSLTVVVGEHGEYSTTSARAVASRHDDFLV
jgi:hypothetical protein